MNEFDAVFKEFNEEVEKVFKNFYVQLQKISTGRANPQLIGDLKVIYYESPTPVSQLASILNNGPLQLLVKPYDISIVKEIEKVLIDSKLPFTVVMDGVILRVTFPQNTTERRKEAVKILYSFSEQAKVGIRQLRGKANKTIKQISASEDQQKRAQQKLQIEVDALVGKVVSITTQKEEQILKI